MNKMVCFKKKGNFFRVKTHPAFTIVVQNNIITTKAITHVDHLADWQSHFQMLN